jgi:hypothetical protein
MPPNQARAPVKPQAYPACYATPGESFSEAEENVIGHRASLKALAHDAGGMGRGWGGCRDDQSQAE